MVNKRRINDDQISVLVQYIEENPQLLSNKFGPNYSKKDKNALWFELANQLNSLGGVAKSPEKWRKTWCDLKSNIKKRAAILRRKQNRTGGGECSSSSGISPLEGRIVGLIDNTISGIKEEAESDIFQQESCENTRVMIASADDCESLTVTNFTPSPPILHTFSKSKSYKPVFTRTAKLKVNKVTQRFNPCKRPSPIPEETHTPDQAHMPEQAHIPKQTHMPEQAHMPEETLIPELIQTRKDRDLQWDVLRKYHEEKLEVLREQTNALNKIATTLEVIAKKMS